MGSLIGSISSLIGLSSRIPWPILHAICCILLTLQVFVLTSLLEVWALCLAGFAGAGGVTASGIRWDTLGQSCFQEKRLHAFASFDQFAGTAGIPIGIVLFGLSGWMEVQIQTAVGTGILAFAFMVPVVFELIKKWAQRTIMPAALKSKSLCIIQRM